MNTKPTPQLIDGRPELFAWIDSIQANQEIAPAELQKTLPNGFIITGDMDKPILHGPLGTSMYLPTMEQWGGSLKVKGVVLLEAIARLTECGPPVWNRSAEVQAQYWRQQIKTADTMMVEQKDPYATRDDMERHVDGCTSCQPAFRSLIEAVNAGSSRTGDAHLKELITRCHEDSAAAWKFYEQIRNSHVGWMPTEKPKKTAREVTA